MDTPVQILLDASEAHQRLHSVELERTSFESKIKDLDEKRIDALSQLQTVKSDFHDAQKNLASLEDQCAALDRQLAQLTVALNSGKLGNYEQGLSQQRQLQDSISKSEDAILDVLESIDSFPSQIERIDEHIAHLNHVLLEVKAERDVREHDLQAQEEVADAEMKAHVKRLPEMEQRRFWAVRQKHAKLIYPLVGNSCGNCHVGIALKQVSLILQAISIYRCSKCGVFILSQEALQSDS